MEEESGRNDALRQILRHKIQEKKNGRMSEHGQTVLQTKQEKYKQEQEEILKELEIQKEEKRKKKRLKEKEKKKRQKEKRNSQPNSEK